MSDIVVYGTRGMGRDALAWLIDAGIGGAVRGFVTHHPEEIGTVVAGLPVLGDLDLVVRRRDVAVVLAAGSTPKRIDALERLRAAGIELVTVVHPSAVVAARSTVGAGSIVCPGAVVCTDVTIGAAVIVQYGALIGHDCVIDDGAFIGPGAKLAGTVHVGPGAHVGLGAAVIQKLAIGAGATVGAGAVVTRSVVDETTVVGVPARPVTDRRTGP